MGQAQGISQVQQSICMQSVSDLQSLTFGLCL